MSNRRSFLKNTTLAATATLLSKPISSIAQASKNASTIDLSQKNVVIYHSSHLNGNMNQYDRDSGGIKHLNKLLDQQQTGGLILDAGNFLGLDQDSAHHYSVISAMNTAGYHTSMPSRQDLSYGEAYLAKLTDAMNFSLVNCNYVFNDLKLAAIVKPWQIINFGKFKVGITGVGSQINSIGYQNPVKKANDTAQYLKNSMNCDLVVCLSDLDYKRKDGMPDNTTLAEKSEAIDLIISSNTHFSSPHTLVLKNATGHDVFIGHSSAKALTMGKIIFRLKEKQKHFAEVRQLA